MVASVGFRDLTQKERVHLQMKIFEVHIGAESKLKIKKVMSSTGIVFVVGEGELKLILKIK